MNYDAIIIGAGLGGLTAGAKLAVKGKKVLLVEQHKVPGGCATIYKRKDYKVEVGLHMIDGLDKTDPKRKLFQDLGVFDNVEFIRVPEFYRVLKSGIDIILPDDYEKAKDILVKKFPVEKDGINKYFKIILAIKKESNLVPRKKWLMLLSMPILMFRLANLLKYEDFTVGQLLDSLFTNEDLKLVLLANFGYYSDDPYTMSLPYFAAGQGSYMSGGGYFIKGGSQVLSDYLASVIENNAGKVIYGHEVEEIIIEEGRAAGIRYRNKKDKADNGNMAYAKKIIANAAIPNVIEHLVKDRVASDLLKKSIGSRQINPSILSVYIGFKKPPGEMVNTSYSTVLLHDEIINQNQLNEYYYGDFSERSLIFADYSQLDSGLAPEGKALGVICTFDRIDDWTELSRDQYKKRKDEVAQILIKRIEKIIPGINNQVDFYEVATPLTIKRYTLNPYGTPYGFSHLPKQAGRHRPKIKSAVKDLYFASAWSEPGHGFSGAILSGNWCADHILGG